MSRTLGIAILAAVLVSTLVGACAASPDPQAEKAVQTARLCAGQLDAARTFDRDRPVTTGTSVAVVLGDSYSQGTGVSDPREDGWATQLGRLEGWTTYVDGVGGTGFTSAGPCLNQQFFTRVPATLARGPAIVVVQGGLNDSTADPAKLSGAVDDLMHRLSGVPRVIVVGPPPAPQIPLSGQVDAVLQARTLAAHREYVSTQRAAFQFLPDRLHLTAAGYRDFAAYVASQLPPAV